LTELRPLTASAVTCRCDSGTRPYRRAFHKLTSASHISIIQPLTTMFGGFRLPFSAFNPNVSRIEHARPGSDASCAAMSACQALLKQNISIDTVADHQSRSRPRTPSRPLLAARQPAAARTPRGLRIQKDGAPAVGSPGRRRRAQEWSPGACCPRAVPRGGPPFSRVLPASASEAGSCVCAISCSCILRLSRTHQAASLWHCPTYALRHLARQLVAAPLFPPPALRPTEARRGDGLPRSQPPDPTAARAARTPPSQTDGRDGRAPGSRHRGGHVHPAPHRQLVPEAEEAQVDAPSAAVRPGLFVREKPQIVDNASR
jgi:hypothetical protein